MPIRRLLRHRLFMSGLVLFLVVLVAALAADLIASQSPTRMNMRLRFAAPGGDRFLLLADYAAYMAAQDRVDALYREQNEWVRQAIINVAKMGKFSSDRSIQDYAKNIWNLKPVQQE